MEFSKLQTVALVVLTTILTDKFLIDHSYPATQSNSLPLENPIQSNPPPSISVSPSPASNNSQTEIILRELINLRKDISANLTVQSSPNTQNPTPTLNSSLYGGMVKISSSQWSKVDVFEKPLASSKIISTIYPDTIYFYRLKQDSWYQLDLEDGSLGWVQAQFLKEFP